MVAKPGTDLYYSIRKLPKAKRDAIVAIHAFNQQLHDTVCNVQEETAVRAKLAWWRDEIQHMLRLQARHPIAQALQDIIKQYALPDGLLIELLDGVTLKLEHNHCCTVKDFELYAYREYGIACILSCYITGFDDHSTLKFAHDMGTVLALTQHISQLRRAIINNQVFIPKDDLSEVDVAELAQLKSSEALTSTLQTLHYRANEYYINGLNKLPKVDKAKQAHLIKLATLNIRLLEEIAKSGYAVLKQEIQLTPLRKLWITLFS